jgi:hypothetical protein
MYCELSDLQIVGVAGMKGRAEDRGIRRNAGQALLRHSPLQFSAVDHRARKVVEPIALAKARQFQ